MNFRKFITMVVVFVALFSGAAFAQTTFYVNNSTGNDANPGTQALPKLTVGSALIAAPSSSIISVAYTGAGNPYLEGAITVKGTYTFTATGGTPVFSNANFNIGGPAVVVGAGSITAANPAVVTSAAHGLATGDIIYITGTTMVNGSAVALDNAYYTVTVINANSFSINYNGTGAGAANAGSTYRTKGAATFTSAFQIQNLNLNQGTVDGANNITVAGGTVYRTELGSITSGQLGYSGATNFVYENLTTAAGVTITTGLEFPVATNVANNLTTMATAGNVTLKLDQNRTINGLMQLGTGANAGGADLNGFTLFFNSGALAHTTDGNITGGTLDFTLSAAASIEGVTSARTLPNINVTASGAFALTVSPGGALVSTVGNVTANGTAGITMQNTGNIGNITNNGSGNITTLQVSAAGTATTGDVLAAAGSTGNITLDVTVVGGSQVKPNSLTMSGQGIISFGANTAGNNYTVAVTGAVVLNTAFTLNNNTFATKAQINFNNGTGVVTVGGALTNSASFSGATNAGGNSTNNGLIQFQNTGNVTITGTTTNSVSGSVTLTGGSTFGTNGTITFASNGTGSFAAITNNSTSNLGTTIGTISTTGNFVGGFTSGLITNSSNTDAAAGHGDIDFRTVTASPFTVSGVLLSGSAKGGIIYLGAGGAQNFAVTNDISCTRAANGGNIRFGVVAVTGTVQANNILNSGAAPIIFLTTSGNVTVNNTISLTGSGNIQFAAATTAAFAAVNLTVNGTGALDFGDETAGAGAGATGAINVTGTTQFLSGNVDMSTGTTGRTMTLSGSSIQIGGLTTNVTFTNDAKATLAFGQPIPNVNQMIKLGTADQRYAGPVQVTNPAVLPGPYVFFQSADASGATPGKLTMMGGDLLFNTGGLVINTVKIDNARIFVGRKNPGGAAGNFQNTTGYVTANGGFVMMSGNAGQTVNALAITAGATFGNFGVDNNGGGANVVTFPGAAGSATMTGDFYLASGDVQVNGALVFNNSTNYPTIYRTEGTFNSLLVAANLASNINVTYYGADKTTANEIPNAGVTDKLWNLTVATTNGAKPGYGVVTMGGAAKVNGTLTINANQALYTAANTLTIAGASAVINGYLVDNGTTLVQLASATGTVFTGAGFLPSIQINNLSAGNSITGYTGLYSNGFGANGVWGGGDDDFTTADGVITYAGGADAGSSLTVGFIGAGPHFGNLTMNTANETFTLTTDVVSSGNILQTGGTIDLGGFNYTHNGTGFATNGTVANGSVIKNGTLIFPTNTTTLTVAGAPMTIAANVSFTANGGTITLPIYAAGVTDNLIINGNVVLNSATGTTVAIGAGNVLKLGGSTVTVGTASLFSAPGAGTGVLDLYNATAGAGLTFTSPAATTVVNLTIDDNVTLAGSVAGGTGVLTVSTAFIHNAGLFTFGTANLQINGTFTRNGGTYAGDGWLIYNGGAAGFSHSTAVAAGAMTINNLKVTASFTLQNARNLNVVKGLWLIGGSITNQVGGSGGGYVFVGDANNIPMVTVDGASSIGTNALQFGNAANADYTFTGAGVATLSTNVWPTASPSRNVVVNLALTGNTVGLGANETINGNLTLTTGNLSWTTPVTVTIASGSTITRNVNGALNRGTGTFTAPNVNLVYTGDFNAVALNTGIEYSDPQVITNLTLGLPNGSTITLNSAKTIAGVVTINGALSVLTINANTTFSAAQTISTGTLNVNTGITLTLAGTTLNTLPTVTVAGTGLVTCAGPLTITGLATGNFTVTGALTLTGGHTTGTVTASSDVTVGANANFAASSNLVFVGTNDATLTVPTAGSLIGALSLNKTNNTNTVTLAGGNVTLGNTLTFINGLFVTGANRLNLFVPTLGAVAAGAASQGFTRAGVTGTNISHVVGNVAKLLVNAGNVAGSSEPRSEFPIGSTTSYKPVAITFNPAFGLPTMPNATIVVSYTDANPNGAVGLPIKDGVATGIDVSKYPNFYWTIASTPFSVGPSTPFDLELTATGFTNFDDINNVRIIRRHGLATDVTNQWLLQGTNDSYDNSVNAGVPTIIQRQANAGLRLGGAVFTLGLKSNMKINPASGLVKYVNTYKKLWLVFKDGMKGYNISDLVTGNIGSLTFVAQSSNNAVATVAVLGSTLQITPVAMGDMVVTVIAQDLTYNDFFAYSIDVNVGPTDVQTKDELPTEFALFQNYPNPFNPIRSSGGS